jgi:hypothetical protein
MPHGDRIASVKFSLAERLRPGEAHYAPAVSPKKRGKKATRALLASKRPENLREVAYARRTSPSPLGLGAMVCSEKRGLLELCPAQGSALDLRTYQAQARHVGSQRS